MNKVDKFGFGTWGLAEWGERNLARDIDLVNFAYESGITFFDTAPVYGNGYSEKTLSYLPPTAFIATKIPGREARSSFNMCYPAETVLSSIEKSIRHLNRKMSLIQFHNWDIYWELTDYFYTLIDSIQSNFGITNIGISMPKLIAEMTTSTTYLISEGLIDYFQVKWTINETQNMHFINDAKVNKRKVILRSLFEQGKILKREGGAKREAFYKSSIRSSLTLEPDKILIGITKKSHLLDLIRALNDIEH